MTDNIAALARDWLEAKRAEAKANEARLAIEDQICAALDVPQEGSKTHKIDGFKVTLTQPVARKVDPLAWDKVKAKCTMEAWPIKTKIEADGAGIKWLQANDPKTWRAISGAFEAKPGKVGVKVEAV